MSNQKCNSRISLNTVSQGSDTDDTEAKELEIQNRKDSDIRMLQDEIETSVSSLFKNDPKIGQNRSTVIVDKLSHIVKCPPPMIDKEKVDAAEKTDNSPGSTGSRGNSKKVVGPPSPRSRISPMGSPKISPRLLVLGNRVRSEGAVPLPNLGLPYTPMNTPRLETNVLNIDLNNIPGSISFMKPMDEVIGMF
jgi:hypothetical protein